jgi:type II secretory pathway pseudopilin PulG
MMRKSPRVPSHSGEAGLSYVEVLVTVVLLALVVAAFLPLLTGGQQGYDETRRRQEMIQNARVALDKLLREIRAAETFQTLSATQISFALFWGDGTGALPTVEYAINPTTNALEYRWKDNWFKRRQITVTAVDAVAASYAVMLTFDHAALVSAGTSLADGNDVRVRYWNGTAYTELDRFLDPTSTWNSSTTKIWFRLQTALSAGATSTAYYLYYGNPQAGPPPANPDNIFLDYEDGTTLDGWTRRDSNSGTYTTSSSDGFVTTVPATGGSNDYRELSKTAPHTNVEIFYGAWLGPTSAADGRGVGVGARLSDTGAGYRLIAGAQSATRLRLVRMNTWAGPDTTVDQATITFLPSTDYYVRFYLVGTALRGKAWQAGGSEPAAWQFTATDSTYAGGNHWDIADMLRRPMDHRHLSLILRPRVANEPTLSPGGEMSGARPDPLASLAGPFRSMSLSCYDAAGASVACVGVASVRVVQVALVVMDPDGKVPDMTLTGRAYRQTP